MTGRMEANASEQAIRVALVGNMNNNHFALMRHLRDLGADAHLFLYSNEHSHFMPQCDTTQWERWKPFVHELGISNGGRDNFYKPVAVARARLKGFDAYLGNGIAPYLFSRMGETLDLFIPYSEGCEFIVSHEWDWHYPLASAYSAFRRRAMKRGLRKNVSMVVSGNSHPHSMGAWSELGYQPADLFMPMIYIEDFNERSPLFPELHEFCQRMDAASVAVFSHVSHFWKNLPTKHYMGGVGKRNQWLIEGFATYVQRSRDDGALLVLVEYGGDVGASKELIDRLEISEQVLWLPLMSRVQIIELLKHADIGGSEFAGMLWGGVGWEFLASGVPMLHYLDAPGDYVRPTRPLPPFFNVDGPEAIAEVLLNHDRAVLRSAGLLAREWYARYQGRALAAQYLKILKRAAERRRRRPAV